MKELPRLAAAAVIGLAVTTSMSPAQEMSVGQREFDNNCAVCHGASGKGDGVLVGLLTTALPDLTTLSKNNGGVFPVARMYEVIDGRAAIASHGTREMPAWGYEYNSQADQNMLGYYYTGPDVDAFVRGRVLALIEYISTLQEE